MKKPIAFLLAVSAISTSTLAANVTETENPFVIVAKPTTVTKKPTKKQLPTATPSTSLSCGSLPRTCYAMTSCAQAQAAYRCGNTKLDRDKDGIPCDKLCQ